MNDGTGEGVKESLSGASVASPHPAMVWIPGGTFAMGSEKHYPEERPVHQVTVDGFWIDRYPVTNERFARFVADTGHVTFAEIPPDPADYPGAAAATCCMPASLVFFKPAGPVDPGNVTTGGGSCGAPTGVTRTGPDSSIEGSSSTRWFTSPSSDAEAFAAVGRQGAARPRPSGSSPPGVAWTAQPYAWGDEFIPGGRHMANTWQGEFPWQNLRAGRLRAAPRRSTPSRPTATACTT